MKSAPLETGILWLFRFFLLVQWFLLLGSVAAHSKHAYLQGNPWFIFGVGSGGILLLAGYLFWPWLREKLGRFYLPLALTLSATFSLYMQNVLLDIRLSGASGSSEETAWTLFLFLFIPLVLVGWQYNFKAVIIYCLFTAVLDQVLMNYGRDDYPLFIETYRRLIFIRTFSFLIAGYVIARIMNQFRQQRAALQRANRELSHYAITLEQLTVSRERNRVARELHDTLAHTLSGIAVQLEGAEALWQEDAEGAHALLRKSLAATRSGLTETRRALQALRASPLEDVGLALALRRLAEAGAERAGLKLTWQVPNSLPELGADVEQGLYRVAQEAFENIVRHAGAHQVKVAWTVAGDCWALSIGDDGCGFSPAELAGDTHYGLQGMQERAQMLGGELQIHSQPGQGTTICLQGKVGYGTRADL